MTRFSFAHILLTAGLVLLAIGASPPTPTAAQTRGALTRGGVLSNFGRTALQGGFMPDPFEVAVAAGGRQDARSMQLGARCHGFITRRPDFILTYRRPQEFLRFYFRADQTSGTSTERDATLVIHDPAERWQCDDDGGGNFNPMVSITSPVAGQYDVWVGSYAATRPIPGRLSITELRSQRP